MDLSTPFSGFQDGGIQSPPLDSKLSTPFSGFYPWRRVRRIIRLELSTPFSGFGALHVPPGAVLVRLSTPFSGFLVQLPPLSGQAQDFQLPFRDSVVHPPARRIPLPLSTPFSGFLRPSSVCRRTPDPLSTPFSGFRNRHKHRRQGKCGHFQLPFRDSSSLIFSLTRGLKTFNSLFGILSQIANELIILKQDFQLPFRDSASSISLIRRATILSTPFSGFCDYPRSLPGNNRNFQLPFRDSDGGWTASIYLVQAAFNSLFGIQETLMAKMSKPETSFNSLFGIPTRARSVT